MGKDGLLVNGLRRRAGKREGPAHAGEGSAERTGICCLRPDGTRWSTNKSCYDNSTNFSNAGEYNLIGWPQNVPWDSFVVVGACYIHQGTAMAEGEFDGG